MSRSFEGKNGAKLAHHSPSFDYSISYRRCVSSNQQVFSKDIYETCSKNLQLRCVFSAKDRYSPEVTSMAPWHSSNMLFLVLRPSLNGPMMGAPSKAQPIWTCRGFVESKLFHDMGSRCFQKGAYSYIFLQEDFQ